MNIKDYIESGLLEAFVLGALSEEEKTRVENDIALHPELAAEVAAIEAAMLGYAQAHAANPPDQLKEKIRTQLSIQQSEKSTSNLQPFTPTENKSSSWQRAAIWMLLLSTATFGILFWLQHNTFQNQLSEQNTRIDSLVKAQNEMIALLEDKKKESEMLVDTSMQTIVMKTMQPEHPMAATVFWGKTKGSVYLSFTKMPTPPQGKQYQLWVIQDGKPVSMGTIPHDVFAKGMMMKVPMKVTNGQAFAISLENEGGNPTPTVVQVLGKV